MNEQDHKLLEAVRAFNPWSAKAALDAGANPNTFTENEGSLLHIVVRGQPYRLAQEKSSERSHIIALLLEKGADPLCKDTQGKTPYYYAARDGLQCRDRAMQDFEKKALDTIKAYPQDKLANGVALFKSELEAIKARFVAIGKEPPFIQFLERSLTTLDNLLATPAANAGTPTPSTYSLKKNSSDLSMSS